MPLDARTPAVRSSLCVAPCVALQTIEGAGWGFDMTNINPNASTGIFAGATGVLYVNTKCNPAPPPTSYVSKLIGVVCFARGMDPRDEWKFTGPTFPPKPLIGE
jgi:hypothetical protein